MKPFFIGLTGISGAGKSTLVDYLESQGGVKRFRFDAYYKTAADCPKLADGRPNWDLPESLYLDEVYDALVQLKDGQDLLIPLYDRGRCDRVGHILFKNAPVIFVEGLHVFAQERLRELFDLRLWLDVSEQEALTRRLQRQPLYDRDYHWSIAVPAHRKHVLPLRDVAHYVINGMQSVKNVVEETEAIIHRELRAYP